MREITGAMHLVATRSVLAWTLLANGLINLLWGIAFIMGVPLLVDRVLVSNIGAYGLIVGAYGVGNVLSNLVIGSITIRRRVPMIFCGKIILGVGFLLLAWATTLPMALLGSALAAVGGPMGDIAMLTMIQTEVPADQIGKVYSLRMVLANVGASLGLLLAVPLFAHFSVMLVIASSAFCIIGIGVAGLLRFGLREPANQ